MNAKMIVEEWLREHKFDGLCNPDVPCGCLCGDLAPCDALFAECQPGHREDVDEHSVCDCDGQGTKHWHVCIERVDPDDDRLRKHFDQAPEWLCDCGERCAPMSPHWRWDGRNWEHYHGYPIGHVTATRSPYDDGACPPVQIPVRMRPNGRRASTSPDAE